jgi:hypothetical protein
MRGGLCEAIGHDVTSRVWNEHIHMGGKQRFFYWRNFARRQFFFTSGLFLAKFGPKKNILVAKNSSILTIFIHLNPFSSTFRAFIQHPDELASGYVLVVPPG